MKSQLEYGGKTLRFEVALPSASCIFGRVLSSFWGKNLSQSPVHAHCPMHLAGSKEISATSVRKFYNLILFYPKTLLIINSSNSLVSVQCLRRSWTHLSRPSSDQIAGIPSSSPLSSPYHDHHWPGTNGPHSSAVLASSARFHLAGRWWMARGRWPPGSSWIFYFNTIEAPEAGGYATGDGGHRGDRGNRGKGGYIGHRGHRADWVNSFMTWSHWDQAINGWDQ